VEASRVGNARGEGEDEGGFLGTAAKVAGLLAGAVAAVYLLGGIVIALRLLFDGFSAGTVVTLIGQLPRELVITTAMLEVIGLAAIVGIAMALCFGGWDGPRERRRVTDPALARDTDKLTAKPRRGLTFAFMILVSLAFTVPAFVQATDAGGAARTARLTAVGFGLLVTFALVAAGWFLIRRLARKDWSRLPKAVAAGGIWAAMAVVPALMFAGLLDFENAQACTTGSATPVRGVLVGETPEHLLLATDVDDEESVLSLPVDGVTKSEYGDLTEFLCEAPGGDSGEDAAAALGEHGSDAERELAAELRPWLRFDGNERWRPLEVTRFLAERFEDGRGHGACASGEDPPCRDIDGLDDLRGETAYLDIHGSARRGADFASPDPECGRAPPAVDCGEGEHSVIYYRRTSHGDRWYWDYWWLMRYNNYNGQVNRCRFICGDHEGDWEGVTVVTTASAAPEILGAIYATHKDRVMIEAAVLPMADTHPLVFIANGTHAAYSFRCADDCKQYSKLSVYRLPEESHDGSAHWAHNDDASCEEVECVRPLPEAAPAAAAEALPIAGEWAAWGGLWGETCHAGCGGWRKGYQPSPRSPGRQDRYKCPWVPTLVATPGAGSGSRLDAREVGDVHRQMLACEAQRGGL
jgi:hypothetical protein